MKKKCPFVFGSSSYLQSCPYTSELTQPIIYTRTSKEHWSCLLCSQNPVVSITSTFLLSTAVIQVFRKGKGVALMLPEVLNYPTCYCYFHPLTRLRASLTK